MEIKVNKDIRQYKETLFLGLTMRQAVCSVLALGVAVGLFILLRPTLGTEGVSWVCIVGATPFAAAGFFSYHGMTLEQFAWAWFKSEWLCAGRRTFRAENIYAQACGRKEDGE